MTTTPSRIVTAALRRNDTRVELDLSIVDGGVRGVWKSGMEASWAIKMATERVDAVRARDLERLARMTAYPFELRDTGRDASCGMTDTPVSGFNGYDRDSPVANWIEPWWRENEHRPLQRVMTVVATVEGYEYDFQG